MLLKDIITGDEIPALDAGYRVVLVQEESSYHTEELHNETDCKQGKYERKDKNKNKSRAGRPTELLNRMLCRWKT